MKRKALALAAIMSATLLCSCAQQGGNASDYAQQNMEAVMGATMNDYVTSSKVTSADSTAHSIKNEFDVFMTDSDVKGYGPKRDSNCTISITVTNGIWTSHVSNTDCFKAGGTVSWENDSVGAMAGDSKTGVTNAANLLEIRLADDFPTVQNAYISAYLEGGRTMFVYYTDSTNMLVPELDAVLASEDARNSFTWASGTSGISKEGYIVGTAPKLP